MPLLPYQSEKARWLFPCDGAEPVENGTVIFNNIRIRKIEPNSTVDAWDWGNVAVIPKLANAHTHLEFSDLTEPITPAEPFTTWIRNVIAHRRSQCSEVSSIQTGVKEVFDGCNSFIGDICTDWDENGRFIPRANGMVGRLPRTIFGRIFLEVIGFGSDAIDSTLSRVASFFESGDPRRLGISPHAPYSVHPELYLQLIELAHKRRLPVAVHLAETKSEIEFLAHQTGEFREMLEEFGIWEEGVIPPGSKPLDYLKPLAKLDRALVIHGNYLDDEEIAFLAEHPNIFVVYCPRTHHYFGHDPHPWLKMKEAGVSLAIGTDSRASNPDLNVFSELKFLAANFPEVDKSWLLDLGTIQTQKALGVHDPRQDFRVGGKLFQTSRVKLPEIDVSDPYELLFHPESQVVF